MTCHDAMIISIQKAIELTGKSRSTIERHIKTGKLSRTNDGIDTSELLRVYGAFKSGSDASKNTLIDTSMTDREQWLMRQIEQLKAEHIEREKQFIERENKLMALIEYLPTKSDKNALWNRIFKGKK